MSRPNSTAGGAGQGWPGGNGADADAIRAHLAEVLVSSPFESSQRCRDLLTYVVENALSGRSDVLKERCIGEDVFGRAGYEPSEQNLVRVTAIDLRKRLAIYYAGHPAGIRVELPRGSYIPVIHVPAEPQPELPAIPVKVLPMSPPTGIRRKHRGLLWIAAALVAAAVIGAFFLWPRSSPEEAFWKPVLATDKAPVIWATGWGAVLSPAGQEELTKHAGARVPFTVQLRPEDVIPVDQLTAYGNVYGIADIMAWLAAHHHSAQLLLGNWLTPADVHDQPLILFGSLNNPWSIDLNRNLRFKVKNVGQQPCIVDEASPDCRWSVPDYHDRGYDVSVDYGLVSRLIDQPSGQVRISIGGICHYASQGGARFLTSPNYWIEIDRVAPKGWQRMNMQTVLEMRVVAKVAQSPKIIAWHFW